MISGVKNLRFCWALVFWRRLFFLVNTFHATKKTQHPSRPSGSIVEATLKRIRDVIVSSAGTLPKLYVSVSLPGDVLESTLATQAGDVEWVRCQKWKQRKVIRMNQVPLERWDESHEVPPRWLFESCIAYLIFNFLGDGCLQLASFEPNLTKLVLIQMIFFCISTFHSLYSHHTFWVI